MAGFNSGFRTGIISQGKHWIHADLSADVAGVGSNTDIVVDEVHSQSSGGISLNVSTGVFTLPAGKVFKFEAKLYTRSYSQASGDAGYEWVYDDNAQIEGAKRAICRPVTHTTQHSQHPTANGILEALSDTDIKLRCVAATGTHELVDLGTNILIVEI